MKDLADYRYRAFISYSHRDEKWAGWLHRAIETYRVPRYLVGQQTPMGTIPARTNPVFRDRDELASATDLGANLRAALEGSACQLVICSPAAAKSHWVNEEILAFKRLGRQDRIFCLIVGGEPYASRMPGREDEECFPPALHYQMGPDGELTDVPAEPIAADAREGKDGKDNAKIKLLAGMLGVGFDALRQRELQRRHRQFAIIAGASFTGMVFAIGLATTAVIARNEAQAQRARAEKEAETARQTTSFLVDLFKVSDPGEARGRSITAREILTAGASRIEGELASQPEVQAQLMETIGTVFTGLGLYDDARGMLAGALAKRGSLPAADPAELSRTQVRLADVLTETADLDRAEPLYRAAIERLQAQQPERQSLQELATATAGLAELYYRNGRYADAEPLLKQVLALRRRTLPAGDPAVADAVEELGLNQSDQGNDEQAERYLRDALTLRRKALGTAPHPDVAENLNNLALLLMNAGRYDESEALYLEATAMNRTLHGAEHPDVATALNNLGLFYRTKGDLARAGQAYLDALAMRRKLLGPDHPETANTLRNLAFVHYDEALLPQAIEDVRTALGIQRKSLGERHPEVASSLSTLGRWLGEAGQPAEAERALREALALETELLGADHPNVAISEFGLADVLARNGKPTEALRLAESAERKAREAFGEAHWITAVATSTHGGVLAALGRNGEAEPLLHASYAALVADPAARPAYVERARERLRAFYRSAGREDEAAALDAPAQAAADPAT